MHSYPAAASDTKCGNFSFLAGSARFQPDTGFTAGPFTQYSILSQRSYNNLFQVTKIFSDICSELFQVQDGITDYLLGAMKSNIPPAVSFNKNNSTFP
jgi:hypothetical protein